MAINVPDSLLFNAADTFGVPLHQYGDHFRGAETKVIRSPSFSVECPVSICSGVIAENKFSVVAKLMGGLWAFAVFESGKAARLWLFDGLALGVRVKDLKTDFCGVSIANTLKIINPFVKGTYVYDASNRPLGWVPKAFADMDESSVEQDAVSSEPCPSWIP